MNLKIVIAFMFLILIVAGCTSGAGDDANALKVTVIASEFKFEPATITVTPDQVVKLTLKNDGVIDHSWTLKFVGFKITAPPGKSETKNFTAPTAPGTYDVDCDIAGHKDAGMIGKLVVK